MALLVLVVLVRLFSGDDATQSAATTYEVRRGDLPITIVEGGSAESLEPRRIKCEVKGRPVKILYLVEEGYLITKDDVEEKKVLVELDSSELEDRVLEQEISYESAKANLSSAEQDYEIQEKQNETDIKSAEREAKFMAMDLQKYLGETLADELIAELHRRRDAEAAAKESQDAARDVVATKKTLDEKQQALEKSQAAAKTAAARKAAKDGEDEGDPEVVKQLAETIAAALDDPTQFPGLIQQAEAHPKEVAAAVKQVRKDPEKAKAMQEFAARAGGGRPGGGRPGGREGGARPVGGGQGGPPGGGGGPGPPKGLRVLMSALRDAGDGDSSEDIDKATKAVEEAREAADAAAQRADETAAALQEAARTAGVAPLVTNDPPTFRVEFEPIEFRKLADDPRLEGEAAQKLTTFGTDIMLEDEERMTAEKQLRGTERLFENEFVTETDLERDRMTVKRRQIGVASKQTNQELFFQYEFPKQAEQAFSKYEEALHKLDRERKEAVTKLLNAQVKRDSSLARFNAREKSLEETREQLEKCIILATHEGLVTYGDPRTRRWREPVREGSEVHDQMTILTIPDITQMAVKVQIHESSIKKVKKGQQATVRVEAFPDEDLTGEVHKVGVMPDSERSWMNPDIKSYEVAVAIDGVYEWLKPGMTAEVEIHITTLEDVLYVPLQAVSSRAGDRVCYLTNGDARVVETDEFNDKYIEITSGLDEGDVILLRPLEGDEEAPEDGEPPEEDEDAQEEEDAAALESAVLEGAL